MYKSYDSKLVHIYICIMYIIASDYVCDSTQWVVTCDGWRADGGGDVCPARYKFRGKK